MRKHVMRLMMTALLMVMVVPFVNAQIKVGDILCEGYIVINADDFDSSDAAAIGVVYYVDDSGEHGWAVALQDAGLFTWGGCGVDSQLENYKSRGSAADDIDGLNNTNTILSLGKNNTAFTAVDFGDGWYLPAAGQLDKLYKNLDKVNSGLVKAGGSIVKPIGVTYWSSTEYSDIEAWYLTTIGGLEHTSDGYNDNKAGRRLVRSVRNF